MTKVFGDRVNFGGAELAHRKVAVLVMLDRIKWDINQMKDDSPLAEILMGCDEFCLIGGPATDLIGEAREQQPT